MIVKKLPPVGFLGIESRLRLVTMMLLVSNHHTHCIGTLLCDDDDDSSAGGWGNENPGHDAPPYRW